MTIFSRQLPRRQYLWIEFWLQKRLQRSQKLKFVLPKISVASALSLPLFLIRTLTATFSIIRIPCSSNIVFMVTDLHFTKNLPRFQSWQFEFFFDLIRKKSFQPVTVFEAILQLLETFHQNFQLTKAFINLWVCFIYWSILDGLHAG